MQTVDKIIMKPINEIVPYEKNPRKNSKTVELLCKIIPKVGFNVPIVIDANNVIVKGHARWLAAKKLGMEQVPCVISTADPESIKADRIADNKVFEFSQWVNDELLHEVDMFEIGFDPSEFDLPVMNSETDFEFFEEEQDFEEEIGEEERKRRFEEFLKRQEQEEPQVQITTGQELEHAKQELKQEASRGAASYLSVTCEKCGHVFYVREGDAMVWE